MATTMARAHVSKGRVEAMKGKRDYRIVLRGDSVWRRLLAKTAGVSSWARSCTSASVLLPAEAFVGKLAIGGRIACRRFRHKGWGQMAAIDVAKSAANNSAVTLFDLQAEEDA